MSNHIFTYGSLMFPEVWERVVRGRYRSASGNVADHARFVVAGEAYPGMISAAGQSVQGIVYFDVSQQDFAALDAFEGDGYRRQTVAVRLVTGEIVTAGTYIYLDATCLENLPWRPEAFRMQRFIDTYCRSRLAE